MTSEEDIQALEQLVYQAPVLFEWEYIGGMGGSSSLSRWISSILLASLLPVFLFFVTDTIDILGLFALLLMFLVCMLMGRFLFNPDEHHHYYLTKLGIHYTQEQLIPEIAYTLVRGFAWVGIAVCLIALFVIGPLAFVGAGAFALMAFGMTNFQSQISKHCILFSDANILFSLNNDVLLFIKPQKRMSFAFSGTIYATSLVQKPTLIAELVQYLDKLEVVDIKRRNDKYKHPVYTSAQSEQ